MNLYIRDNKTNFYFNSDFLNSNKWVENVDDALCFDLDDENVVFNPMDVIPDPHLYESCDLVFVYIDGNEIKTLDLKKNIVIGDIIDYDDYISLKNDFVCYKDKDFVHYIIYCFIKSNKPLKSVFFSKSKKMKLTINKIKKAKFLIENRFYTMDYLKKPFSSISIKKFNLVLKSLEDEI